MKNIIKKLLLLVALIVIPVGVLAEPGVRVSPTSLNIETGKTKTFTITTTDVTGSISISSSDNDVALVSTRNYDFEAGSAGESRNETITVTGVNPGTATIQITITGETVDGTDLTGRTETVEVTVKSISSNNNLSDIKINGTSIAGFSKTKTSYDIDVEEQSVTITATTEDASAKVTGTGTKALNYGVNKIELKVTAENGSTKTYTLNLNRKDTRDSNNNLSSLTIDHGTLDFNKTKTSYDVEVESDIEKVTINATPESSKAKISGHGLVTLKYGKNKVEVKVTAENGDVKTYTLNINRLDSRDSNNYLSSLDIDKASISFNKETLTYTVDVNNTVDKIVVSGTPESEKATVTGLGDKTLKVGANKIEIKVTAENGSVRTYTITVNRLEPIPGSDFITSLTVEGKEIGFDPNVMSYNIALEEEENTLNFNYEVKDGEIGVSIEGNENLEDGSVVTLIASKNDVSISYTFNITKEKPEPVVVEKPKSKKWMFIVGGILVLLLVVGTIAKAKDKKKKTEPKNTDEPLQTIENEINAELTSTEVIGEATPSIPTPPEPEVEPLPGIPVSNEPAPVSIEQQPVEAQQNQFDNVEKF